MAAVFAGVTTPADAAHTAVILEEIAAMALETITANPKAISISKHLQKKHFFSQTWQHGLLRTGEIEICSP